VVLNLTLDADAVRCQDIKRPWRFFPFSQGTFANGTQVAVKQLFSKSQQSLDIFLNEVVLVAAVKHRNLVKLKGCCIRRDQRLLVHEYVELGDLEQLLFGKFSSKELVCDGCDTALFQLVVSFFNSPILLCFAEWHFVAKNSKQGFQ